MDERHIPMTDNVLFALLLAAVFAALTVPIAAELHPAAAAGAFFAAIAELQHS